MTTETNTSKAPTHIAWNVRENGDNKFWDRVGVAWEHADGEGTSIQLNSLPLDGRIVLRTRKEKPDQDGDE